MSSFEDLTKWGRPEPPTPVPMSFPDGRSGFDLLAHSYDPSGQLVIQPTNTLMDILGDHAQETFRFPVIISADKHGKEKYIHRSWFHPFLVGWYSQSYVKGFSGVYQETADHPGADDDFWRHVNMALYGCHPPIQVPPLTDPNDWLNCEISVRNYPFYEDHQRGCAATENERYHLQQQNDHSSDNEENFPIQTYSETSPATQTHNQNYASASRMEGETGGPSQPQQKRSTGSVSSSRYSPKKRSRYQSHFGDDTAEDRGTKKPKTSSQKLTHKRLRDQDNKTDGRVSKKQKVSQQSSQSIAVVTSGNANEVDPKVMIKYRPKGSRVDEYYDGSASGWDQQGFAVLGAQVQREIIQGLRNAGAQLKHASSASSRLQNQQTSSRNAKCSAARTPAAIPSAMGQYGISYSGIGHSGIGHSGIEHSAINSPAPRQSSSDLSKIPGFFYESEEEEDIYSGLPPHRSSRKISNARNVGYDFEDRSEDEVDDRKDDQDDNSGDYLDGDDDENGHYQQPSRSFGGKTRWNEDSSGMAAPPRPTSGKMPLSSAQSQEPQYVSDDTDDQEEEKEEEEEEEEYDSHDDDFDLGRKRHEPSDGPGALGGKQPPPTQCPAPIKTVTKAMKKTSSKQPATSSSSFSRKQPRINRPRTVDRATTNGRNEGWSSQEHDILFRAIKARRETEKANDNLPKLKDEKFYKAMEVALKQSGITNRSWSACKNYWTREGRARAKYDERYNPRNPDVLRTSVQVPKKKKGGKQ